ncbi:MAG: replication initiation protein RepC [Rhizobiaceae bacterium]
MSSNNRATAPINEPNYNINNSEGFAVLPGTMMRGELEGLLLDVSNHIDMSDSLLKCLLTMMRETRPSDWTDPTKEPICFTMQNNIAFLVGKDARSVRRDEFALEKVFQFIRKEVAGNGSRCRFKMGGDSEFRQGLSFSPLIEAVPDLLALRERVRSDRQQTIRLKRMCSALRRNVKNSLMALQPRFPDNAELQVIANRFLDWPRRYAAFKTLTALEDHYQDVLITSEAIDDLNQLFTDMSAQAVTRVRPYIQDTTQDTSVTCNASVNKRTDDKSSDTNTLTATPNGSADCLENKYAAANLECNNEFTENLTPNRLFWLSSEEMQLYITGHQGERATPNAMDFILASIDRLAELGINRSAYNAALEQMGDMATALCILIIDRNRFHPETPIKNPGGVLRAMTARHRAGALNLTGSLIGITERDKA